MRDDVIQESRYREGRNGKENRWEKMESIEGEVEGWEEGPGCWTLEISTKICFPLCVRLCAVLLGH